MLWTCSLAQARTFRERAPSRLRRKECLKVTTKILSDSSGHTHDASTVVVGGHAGDAAKSNRGAQQQYLIFVLVHLLKPGFVDCKSHLGRRAV